MHLSLKNPEWAFPMPAILEVISLLHQLRFLVCYSDETRHGRGSLHVKTGLFVN